MVYISLLTVLYTSDRLELLSNRVYARSDCLKKFTVRTDLEISVMRLLTVANVHVFGEGREPEIANKMKSSRQAIAELLFCPWFPANVSH